MEAQAAEVHTMQMDSLHLEPLVKEIVEATDIKIQAEEHHVLAAAAEVLEEPHLAEEQTLVVRVE
jgi:hypothetical protein